jgi:hypothetical protein
MNSHLHQAQLPDLGSLTTAHAPGMIGAMAAAELVLWRVSAPVQGPPHEFKYRLAAQVVNGIGWVGSDSEAGMGDTRRFGRRERPYDFTTPEALPADFETISRGEIVTMVTLEVSAPEESMAGFVQARRTGEPDSSARIGFSSLERLWKVFSPKRWVFLKAMCGAGPLSIREAAGLLDRTESGAILFPFEAVKVEFLLRAA